MFESALHYLSFVIGTIHLVIFVGIITAKIPLNLQLIIYILACLTNYFLGVISRKYMYRRKNKKSYSGPAEIFYFSYSATSVFLITTVIYRFFNFDSKSMLNMFFTNIFNQMYFYFVLLALLSFIVYLINAYLYRLLIKYKLKLLFIFPVNFLLFFLFISNAKLYLLLLLKLWSTPIVLNIFSFVSLSPLYYYLKASYSGSYLADHQTLSG